MEVQLEETRGGLRPPAPWARDFDVLTPGQKRRRLTAEELALKPPADSLPPWLRPPTLANSSETGDSDEEDMVDTLEAFQHSLCRDYSCTVQYTIFYDSKQDELLAIPSVFCFTDSSYCV